MAFWGIEHPLVEQRFGNRWHVTFSHMLAKNGRKRRDLGGGSTGARGENTQKYCNRMRARHTGRISSGKRPLRRYCNAVAIVCFLLLSGFLVSLPNAQESSNGIQPKENPFYAFWKWTTHDPVAFYTSVLALFTFVLSVSQLDCGS
jgi:hypothetical protein